MCLLLSLITVTLSCAAHQRQDPAAVSRGRAPESTNPGLWLALLFRNYISAVDGDRCPSIPTCSAYSTEVFKRYGFIKGWIMTVDRLIHEANEGDYSPLVYREGKIRILDTPESNDIW
jgi:uncharacterized protein